MGRSPARRARALLSAVASVAVLAFGAAAAPAARTPSPSRWTVTVAIRIAGGTGAPMTVRLALPADTDAQQVGAVEVTRLV